MSRVHRKTWGGLRPAAGPLAGLGAPRKHRAEAGQGAGRRLKPAPRLAVYALLFLSPSRAETLENVLRQMDNSAASFKSLTAHIRNVKYTAIVNDKTVDEGTIFVKRVKPRVSVLLIEFTI